MLQKIMAFGRRHGLALAANGVSLIASGLLAGAAIAVTFSPPMPKDRLAWFISIGIVVVGQLVISSAITVRSGANDDRIKREELQAQKTMLDFAFEPTRKQVAEFIIKQKRLDDIKDPVARETYETSLEIISLWLKHQAQRPPTIWVSTGAGKDNWEQRREEHMSQEEAWRRYFYNDFQSLGLGTKVVHVLKKLTEAGVIADDPRSHVGSLLWRMGVGWSGPDDTLNLANELGAIALGMPAAR